VEEVVDVVGVLVDEVGEASMFRTCVGLILTLRLILRP
jgi:hypothetical protein